MTVLIPAWFATEYLGIYNNSILIVETDRPEWSSMQMLAYLSVEIVNLAFTCAKFEKCIYRAEAKDGCDQQDHAEYYQDNAKRACDQPTNI